MEISNPRRVLAVSLEASTQQLSKVIKDLTGSLPEPVSSTLAGTTHNLQLTTPYYSAQVPIWLDLISAPSEWADTFLSDEAKEVLEVVGGVVVVFALPGTSTKPPSSSSIPGSAPRPPPTKDETKDLIAHVGRVVRDGLGGWEWDGVGLGIGVGDLGTDDPDLLDEWEDVCGEAGLEFVHARATRLQEPADGQEEARNEFGEKTGIARVLEALQSNDWQGTGTADGEDEDEFGLGEIDALGRKGRGKAGDEGDEGELDPESLDFGFDRADFEGLKKAIWSAGQNDDEDFLDGLGPATKEETATDGMSDDKEITDEDVQKLERMFTKLQAVRDQSAGLPEDQRKKMAKRAVTEVMKEL